MKIVNIIFFIFFTSITLAHTSDDIEFNKWLNNFKIYAEKEGISTLTINNTMNNVKYLPKVIKYDRYQPEFYEDTATYINKRVNKSKIKKGLNFYNSKKEIINNVETKFIVDKELLLALMGIETNFGTYLGKMDILSSLATLSYDKRRSEFFTKELITLLKLIDQKKVDPNVLYGSWAGAYGNFQFMPSTIKNYALDFNGDNKIDLKNSNDSFASAANYISKIGWKNEQPCFFKINLDKKIPKKYLNTSAKKIHNKKKLKFFKKYISDIDKFNLDENLIIAIVTPDKDIVDNADIFSPAFIVFNNYEIILKWNRSLRFALAVCTLKNQFKNEL